IKRARNRRFLIQRCSPSGPVGFLRCVVPYRGLNGNCQSWPLVPYKGGSAMTVKRWNAVRMLVVLTSSLGASLAVVGYNAARATEISALVAEENGNLDKLDITTGAVSIINNSGTVYEGLAYNANESVL